MEAERNLGKVIGPQHLFDREVLIDCADPAQVRTYSRKELDAAFDACARGLVRRGLVPGDAVAIVAANSAAFVIAYFGAMRAGMVAVPVNHKLPADTIHFILGDCNARLVFCDAERLALLGEKGQSGTHDVPSIVLDAPDWEAFLDHGPFEAFDPSDDSVAMILYTSGSTGRPKGVMLAHKGQVWALYARLLARKSFEDERFIVAAPLFHMNGLASVQFALAAGASMVLQANFKAVEFIRAIGDYGVTWITSVPTMMALVVREQDALARIDTRGVRYVRMGSAATTGQLRAAVKMAFPEATLSGGYGTTEAGPITFGPMGGKVIPDGSLGWPLPDVKARIVDANGVEGNQGELWLHTPANMTGYLNLPEKTAAVLSADGWYRTGDMFERDPQDGSYRFVGRVDDMFNCGGENIYPGEVEQVLERMPEVMQACVVAVPDEIKGHKPVAFVVLQEGADADEQAVKAFALANAPAYQHPRRVYFMESLPLASTNKVDRKWLTEQALASANLPTDRK